MTTREFLVRCGLDPDEPLRPRFSEWSDCYSFIQDAQTFQRNAQDLWVLADELWALVQHSQEAGETPASPAASAASSRSGEVKPTETGWSPKSMLERAVSGGNADTKIQHRNTFDSEADMIVLGSSSHDFDANPEFGKTGAARNLLKQGLTTFGSEGKAEEYYNKKVDEMPVPDCVKSVLKSLIKIRRPSLMNGWPTGIIHFYFVESSSMSLVLFAWLLIVCSRLTDSWYTDEARDLVSCTTRFGYLLMANPFQSDYEGRCVDDLSQNHTALNQIEPDLPLEFCLLLYIPSVFLLVLLLFRTLLCVRYNGAKGGMAPVNFASGQYSLFCWELCRNSAHKRILRATLVAFVASLVFIAYYNFSLGIRFDLAGTQLVFNIIVLLDKLADLNKGTVPVHRFQEAEFFKEAIFSRTWLSMLTETSFHFSTRLMDALWSCRAGDQSALRSILERRQKGGMVRVDEFFRRCEHAQKCEANEKDREKGYAPHDDAIEGHARVMFGDDMDLSRDWAGANQMMEEAIAMQADSEAYAQKVKQMLAEQMHKAQEKLDRAHRDKRHYVIQAFEKEKELEKLRSLGEKLLMRDKECFRLREAADDAAAKGSQIAQLEAENKRLRDWILSVVKPGAGHSTPSEVWEPSQQAQLEHVEPPGAWVARYGAQPEHIAQLDGLTPFVQALPEYMPRRSSSWSNAGAAEDGVSREPSHRTETQPIEQHGGREPFHRTLGHADWPDGRTVVAALRGALTELIGRPEGQEPVHQAVQERSWSLPDASSAGVSQATTATGRGLLPSSLTPTSAPWLVSSERDGD